MLSPRGPPQRSAARFTCTTVSRRIRGGLPLRASNFSSRIFKMSEFLSRVAPLTPGMFWKSPFCHVQMYPPTSSFLSMPCKSGAPLGPDTVTPLIRFPTRNRNVFPPPHQVVPGSMVLRGSTQGSKCTSTTPSVAKILKYYCPDWQKPISRALKVLCVLAIPALPKTLGPSTTQ